MADPRSNPAQRSEPKGGANVAVKVKHGGSVKRSIPVPKGSDRPQSAHVAKPLAQQMPPAQTKRRANEGGYLPGPGAATRPEV